MRQLVQSRQYIGRHCTVMNVHVGISIGPLCNMIIKKGTMCTEWYIGGWGQLIFTNLLSWPFFQSSLIYHYLSVMVGLFWINIFKCTSASPLNRFQFFQYFYSNLFTIERLIRECLSLLILLANNIFMRSNSCVTLAWILCFDRLLSNFQL